MTETNKGPAESNGVENASGGTKEPNDNLDQNAAESGNAGPPESANQAGSDAQNESKNDKNEGPDSDGGPESQNLEAAAPDVEPDEDDDNIAGVDLDDGEDESDVGETNLDDDTQTETQTQRNTSNKDQLDLDQDDDNNNLEPGEQSQTNADNINERQTASATEGEESEYAARVGIQSKAINMEDDFDNPFKKKDDVEKKSKTSKEEEDLEKDKEEKTSKQGDENVQEKKRNWNPNFRKKFGSKEEFREAQKRQIEESNLLKLKDIEGNLLNWKKITVPEIGEKTQSIGIKLYFHFLKRGACLFFVWTLIVASLIYACIEPSNYDQRHEVSSLAIFTLASFGDNNQDMTASDRSVRVFGISISMMTATPIFAWLSAGGAMIVFVYMVWFDLRVVNRETELLDKSQITPADFTVVIDYLPSILSSAKNTSQVAPETQTQPQQAILDEKNDAENATQNNNLIEGEHTAAASYLDFHNSVTTTVSASGFARGIDMVGGMRQRNNQLFMSYIPTEKEIRMKKMQVNTKIDNSHIMSDESDVNDSRNKSNGYESSFTLDGFHLNTTESGPSYQYGGSSSSFSSSWSDSQSGITATNSDSVFSDQKTQTTQRTYDNYTNQESEQLQQRSTRLNRRLRAESKNIKPNRNKVKNYVSNPRSIEQQYNPYAPEEPFPRFVSNESSQNDFNFRNFENYEGQHQLADPKDVNIEEKKDDHDDNNSKSDDIKKNDSKDNNSKDLNQDVNKSDSKQSPVNPKLSPEEKKSALLASSKKKALENKKKIEEQSNSFHKESYVIELKNHLEGLVNAARETRQENGDFVPPTDLGPATVEDISLVRDYTGLLAVFKRDFELERDLGEAETDGDQKRIDEAKQKLEKWEIKKASFKGGSVENNVDPRDRPVMRAYVTWRLAYDKELCEEIYKESTSSMMRLFQESNKQFYGHSLKIGPAPEPDNILWENEDIRFSEKVMKKGLVNVLVLLILIIAAFGMIITNSQRDNFSDSASTKNCGSTSDAVTIQTTTGQTIAFTEEIANQYIANVTSTVTFNKVGNEPDLCPGTTKCKTFNACQCSDLGTFKIMQDNDIRSYCQDYFVDYTMFHSITSGAAIAVIMVNLLLQYSLTNLILWERPRTLSKLHSLAMGKIFFAQFFNTTILIILINSAQAKPYIPGSKGEYRDFSHQWYASVGLAVSLTMFFNIFSPHGIDIIRARLREIKSGCCASCCASTEEDLSKIYAPLEFAYSARIAAVLNTVFSTLVFAPGCPLLIAFACLHLVLCFWSDKYILIKKCKRPPTYDQEVMVTFMAWIPLGFLLHACFGIWTMGNQDVFPSHTVGAADSVLESFGIETKDGTADTIAKLENELGIGATFVVRCLTQAGVPWVCLFFLVLTYFFFRNLYRVFGYTMEKWCWTCFMAMGISKKKKRASREGFAEDETMYHEERETWIKTNVIPGYQLADNPKWREMLDMGPMSQFMPVGTGGINIDDNNALKNDRLTVATTASGSSDDKLSELGTGSTSSTEVDDE